MSARRVLAASELIGDVPEQPCRAPFMHRVPQSELRATVETHMAPRVIYSGRLEGLSKALASMEGCLHGDAYEEGFDEPLAWTLFLGSSSMEMGKMLSCTVHSRTQSAEHSAQASRASTALQTTGAPALLSRMQSPDVCLSTQSLALRQSPSNEALASHSWGQARRHADGGAVGTASTGCGAALCCSQTSAHTCTSCDLARPWPCLLRSPGSAPCRSWRRWCPRWRSSCQRPP